METRRLVLLMIFSLSLIMLWDNYQASIGNSTLFGLNTGANTRQQGATASPGLDAKPLNDLPQAAKAVASDVPAGPVKNGFGSISTRSAAEAKTITVKTEVLELQFSTQGAQLIGSKLLMHPSAENPELPVQLFEQSSKRTYVAQSGLVGSPDAPNHRTLFELISSSTEFAPGQDELKLIFKATSGGVENITTYTISKNRYDMDLLIAARNVGPEAITPSAYVQITRDGSPLESDSSLYATFTGPAVYTPEKKYQKIKFDHIADRSANYVKTAESGWLAMIQHYFVSAIVGQTGPRENYTRQVDSNLYSIGLVSGMGSLLPEQAATYSAKLYTGPQDQRVLEQPQRRHRLLRGLDAEQCVRLHRFERSAGDAVPH